MKRRCFLRLAFPSRSFGTRKYRLIFNNSGLEGGVSAWRVFAPDFTRAIVCCPYSRCEEFVPAGARDTLLGDVLHVH